MKYFLVYPKCPSGAPYDTFTLAGLLPLIGRIAALTPAGIVSIRARRSSKSELRESRRHGQSRQMRYTYQTRRR